MVLKYFDVPGFGADFAYTVDGGSVVKLNNENFKCCKSAC